MIVDRDAFWQWRLPLLPLFLSLFDVHALRRFIVTVMIIRLFADKLSLLARVSFQDF